MLRQTDSGDNPLDRPCPACGAEAGFHKHGWYERWLVHRRAAERLRVMRVRCRACGATHAVLGPWLVPYRQRSLGFHLAVLEAWARGLSNAEVREMFDISETTRRRMLSRARDRASALLGAGATRSQALAALVASGLVPPHDDDSGVINRVWRMAPAERPRDTVP